MLVYDPRSGRSFFSKRRRRFNDERMPRELTFSCYRRLPLLSRDRTRKWFIDALADVRTEWSVDLWAWVIMPEHVHLLIAPRQKGVDVGRVQGALKGRVAKQAMTWLDQHAPEWIERLTVREGDRVRRRFWQPGGGYDRNVENSDTLASIVNYFHMNPVKRGLVSLPEDWPWSSARWYAGTRPTLIEMDPIEL
jgi:putative transposase